MQSGYRYILYIFVALIIASGLGLLIFRDAALSFLNDNTAISQTDLTVKIPPVSKNALDNSILSSANFIALKNNVTKFDFDTICNSSVGKIEVVSTSSEGVVSTTTQTVNCVKGNGVPFALPVKKK